MLSFNSLGLNFKVTTNNRTGQSRSSPMALLLSDCLGNKCSTSVNVQLSKCFSVSISVLFSFTFSKTVTAFSLMQLLVFVFKGTKMTTSLFGNWGVANTVKFLKQSISQTMRK